MPNKISIIFNNSHIICENFMPVKILSEKVKCYEEENFF